MGSSNSCPLCSCVFPDGSAATRSMKTLDVSDSPPLSLVFDIWDDDSAVISVITPTSRFGDIVHCYFFPSFCPSCGRPLKGYCDG